MRKASKRTLRTLLTIRMGKYTKPAEDLLASVKEYADIRIDDVKLRCVKGLSITMNHLVSLILVLFAVSVVLLSLGAGLIILIGKAIGSYAGGAFIAAGIFAIIAAVIFCLRDKLFVNSFVRMFIRIFFDGETEEGQL